MSTATTTTKSEYTPEDLLRMPNGENYELVNGQLVERNMGYRSGRIGLRLGSFLLTHCEARGLGWVAGPDAGFQCFPDDSKRVRKPDASFIRKERIPAGEEPEGYCRIVPDLVVEVNSPNDGVSEVETKVEEYLAAGVQLVWVVDPPTRSIRVYRLDGTLTKLQEKDELSGENVVAGFRCNVSDIFQTPVPAEPANGSA